jgi:hypothetical protein
VTYLAARTVTLEGAAQVIDYDIGTSRCEKEGVCLSQSTTSTGDHHGLVVESQLLYHLSTSYSLGCRISELSHNISAEVEEIRKFIKEKKWYGKDRWKI